jgi:hypothetical protein
MQFRRELHFIKKIIFVIKALSTTNGMNLKSKMVPGLKSESETEQNIN